MIWDSRERRRPGGACFANAGKTAMTHHRDASAAGLNPGFSRTHRDLIPLLAALDWRFGIASLLINLRPRQMLRLLRSPFPSIFPCGME